MEQHGARIGHEIVLRAVERNELAPGTSSSLILDSLAGTIIHHVLMTPADRLPALQAKSASYAETVVDFVLRGAQYRPEQPSVGATELSAPSEPGN